MKFIDHFDQDPDPNMRGWYWHNMDPAQTHYFVSDLFKIKGLRELYKNKLECPAGKVLLVPHRYYRIYVRDGDPKKKQICGATLTDEMIRAYPPSMFTKGGALGDPP